MAKKKTPAAVETTDSFEETPQQEIATTEEAAETEKAAAAEEAEKAATAPRPDPAEGYDETPVMSAEDRAAWRKNNRFNTGAKR